MSGWSAALRIARRDARCAKGRSALVVTLIGLPVLGLTFAAVSYDMARLTPAERVERLFGGAEAELRWVLDGPLRQADALGQDISQVDDGAEAPPMPPERAGAADVEALLPPGSRAVPGWEGQVQLPTAAGVGLLEWLAVDLADPVTTGSVSLTRGTAPAAAGREVAVTAAAATRLGVDLGDRMDVPGAGRYEVVGLVEFPGVRDHPRAVSLRAQVLVFHPDARPDGGTVRWLVDTAGQVTWEQVRELNRHGITVHSRAVVLAPPAELLVPVGPAGQVPGQVPVFATGVLVAGLAALEIVLLAGPAFAVGARRRQRDLALVAAGGGTPAHLRRIVLADGMVLGALAAVVGLATGIVLAFAARPLVELYLVGARAGGYRVFPVALAGIAAFAVGTAALAALVPAVTAARQPVVPALAGRRGVTRSRRRWLALGAALVGAGVAVTAAGAWRVSATVVLAGLILGQLGLALCTPSLIGLIARLGARLPLPARIALRDTARNRSAAAPAVAAVMAAVAGAVGAGVIALGLVGQSESPWSHQYAPGTVIIFQGHGYATTTPPDVLGQVARATLPVAGVHRQWTVGCAEDGSGADRFCELTAAVVPAERVCPYWQRAGELTRAEQAEARRDPRCAGSRYGPYARVTVDDGGALPALVGGDDRDLAAAARMLRDGGAVVTDAKLLSGGQLSLAQTEEGTVTDSTVSVPGYLLATGIERDGAIISPQAARAVGTVPRPDGELLVATTRYPTQAEQDAFYAALAPLGTSAVVVPAPVNRAEPYLIVLTVAAIGIALGAAAIATGLAAADRRPDLSTLAAVGASPGLRRRLSLSQSGVIAGLGTGLGLAAGLGASTAVLVALNQRYAQVWPGPDPIPVTVPWTQLLALLAIPAVAMLGAGLLTRSRLPVERRLS
jgi:putative ABC transport system permease protein